MFKSPPSITGIFIILVSETHLSRDIDNEDIQLRGFQNPIRVDRNRHGGGVAIFDKPNIYICEKPEFHTSEIEINHLQVLQEYSNPI
jgi:hypothetical protein